MRRLSFHLGFILALWALASCGKDTPVTVDSLLPAENAIPGWKFDPVYPIQPIIKTAAELQVGDPGRGGTGGIDGSATPFVAHNFSSFVQRFYANGDYRITVWIFQMPDTATSVSLYNDIIVNDEVQKSAPWAPASVGEAGRIAFTGATAVLHARKGLFFFEVKLSSTNGDLPESTKQSVIDFGNAIAAKVK